MNIVFAADRYASEKDAKDTLGALLWVSQIVAQLRELGHNVCVIAENDQALGVFKVPSKSYHVVNMLLKKRLSFGKCDEIVVRKALEGADIVHFITPFRLSAGVRKIAQDMGIPCVASFACTPEDLLCCRPRLLFAANYLYRRWHNRFYKHITDIHCLTDTTNQRLQAQGYIGELHTIGNGSNESYLSLREDYAQKSIASVDAVEMIVLYKTVIAKQLQNTDAHKIHLPQTLSLKLDENYAFVNRKLWFLIPAFLFKYLIVYPIFYTVTALLLGFRAIGRRNLKAARSGAVTVSNHVHMLDAPMLTFSLFPRQPVISSIKGNFETPGIAFLVRILGAVPIPLTPKALAAFMRAMTSELNRNRIVHFYPEASLWPGHTELRPFKNGAFHLAVISGKPVIPMVVKPRTPSGLYKLFKKKPCITVQIGQAIAPPTLGSNRERIETLKQNVHAAMEAMLGSVPEADEKAADMKAAQ